MFKTLIYFFFLLHNLQNNYVCMYRYTYVTFDFYTFGVIFRTMFRNICEETSIVCLCFRLMNPPIRAIYYCAFWVKGNHRSVGASKGCHNEVHP